MIRRNVLENPAWYTAYTPYQPEISQGRLEALLNFQTMVTDLTGLATANASMLDEGTAAAEAMTLARRASQGNSHVYVVDADTLPQTIAVLAHPGRAAGHRGARRRPRRRDDAAGGVLRPAPAVPGRVRRGARPRRRWSTAAHAARRAGHGRRRPAGADACCARRARSAPTSPPAATQRFGVPMGFGGPHAGYLAVRAGLERSLPGRLVGVSRDADGAPAYRLALQTREQHIRREKATSNICTAQVLLAVMASMYAVYHGPDGLRGDRPAAHPWPRRRSPPACAPPASRWRTTRSSTR